MTWTYDFTDFGDPDSAPLTAAQLRNRVRLALGDTDTNDQQLQDEEIALLLQLSGNGVLSATILGCDRLCAKFARQTTTGTPGGLNTSSSDRHKHYKSLKKALEDGEIINAVPSAGGQSIAGKASAADDADLVQPQFEVGMDDRAGTGLNDSVHDDEVST